MDNSWPLVFGVIIIVSVDTMKRYLLVAVHANIGNTLNGLMLKF